MQNHFKPLDKVMGVYADARNENSMAHFEWGLVPPEDKALKWRGRLYNIRCETVLEAWDSPRDTDSLPRRYYRQALKFHRAIIPANELFEPEKVEGLRTGRVFRIRPRMRRSICIAAFHSEVKGDFLGLTGMLRYRTIGMLTQEHPRFGRIPVLLGFEEALHFWLNVHLKDERRLSAFLERPPSDEYDLVEVEHTERQLEMEMA